MGHAERRQRDQLALKNRILDAARDLFAEFGYEAVTMRRIAQRIEYSPTTIYLHFRNKAELMRELCRVDFLALAARFRMVGVEGDPVARLQGIGRAFVTFALAHPNHYRLMFMTSHPPVPAEARGIAVGSLEEDAWAILVAAVADAQREGALRAEAGRTDAGRAAADRADAGRAEAIAQLFFASVHGVVALHLARGSDPWIGWTPVLEASELMMVTLIHGLSAP